MLDATGDQWVEETYDGGCGMDVESEYYDIYNLINQGDNIRVKHLDVEQIESLGWKKSSEENIYGYFSFKCTNSDDLLGDECSDCESFTYRLSQTGIDQFALQKYVTGSFGGSYMATVFVVDELRIKNISELRNMMKMFRITR